MSTTVAWVLFFAITSASPASTVNYGADEARCKETAAMIKKTMKGVAGCIPVPLGPAQSPSQ